MWSLMWARVKCSIWADHRFTRVRVNRSITSWLSLKMRYSVRLIILFLVILMFSSVIGLPLGFATTPVGVTDVANVAGKKAPAAPSTQKIYSASRTAEKSMVPKNEKKEAVAELPDKIGISLDSKTDWVQVLLTLLAIVTVIGTTCVSIYTIKKKTEESIKAHDESVKSQTKIAELNNRTQVLSTNRQAWINTLREEIAQYLSDLHILQFEKNLGSEMDKKNCSLALKNAYFRRNKIQLLINPEEEDHQQLVSMIYDALPATSKSIEELNDIEAQLIAISQKILKREWMRVKAVE